MVFKTPEQVAVAADAFASNWKQYYGLPIDEAVKIDAVIPDIQRAFSRGLRNADRQQAMGTAEWFFVFSKWRLYKTIYRFKQGFYSVLMNTDDTTFHQEAIKRLPVNCYFVASSRQDEIGFFSYIETVQDETFFHVISIDDVRGNQLHGAADSMWIRDGQSIDEALKAWMDTINQGADYSEYYDRAEDNLRAAIQTAYYLSAQNAEVSEVRIPKKKRPKRSNGTTLNLRQWDVGYRIGNQFIERKKPQYSNPYDDEDGNIVDDRQDRGNSPRPHVRRAHWHHYWAGEGKKTLILKWLAPIMVNGSNEEIIPTEHQVRH